MDKKITEKWTMQEALKFKAIEFLAENAQSIRNSLFEMVNNFDYKDDIEIRNVFPSMIYIALICEDESLIKIFTIKDWKTSKWKVLDGIYKSSYDRRQMVFSF